MRSFGLLRHIRSASRVARRPLSASLSTTSAASASSRKVIETEEWGIFPFEREGNEYLVNWSLADDGITSAGEGFRNARLPVLAMRLPSKIENGKTEAASPEYYGNASVLEAGASISFDDFEGIYSAQKEYLSSGVDLFIEDRALGSFAPYRLGTRLVTDNAAVALIFRTLLIDTPPRQVDHRARFDGWNRDERWNQTEFVWKGDAYDIIPGGSQVAPKKGERPILATIGGSAFDGKSCAVQLLADKKTVGANILAGNTCNVMGIIGAIGQAFSDTLNDQVPEAVALPSLAIIKNNQTGLIFGAPDDFNHAAVSKGFLYGAYHNIVSARGTAAVWNGVVAPAGADVRNSSKAPAVVVKGVTARSVNPNNLAFVPSSIFFYEKGAKKSELSRDLAIQKIKSLCPDESKVALIEAMVNNCTGVFVVGTLADVI